MKAFQKIIASLFAMLLIVSSMSITANAANNELYLETNIDKTLEIPLTLKGSTDTFYLNANINPGDIMEAKVLFKNTSTEDIQVRISDVTDQLGTTDSAALLEILNLDITTNGSPIYRGTHNAVTTPLTQWMSLEAGDVLTMTIKVEFPKWEADNNFQGAQMKVKYVFEARADIPLDDLDSDEIVKTGVETEENNNPAAIVMIVLAVILLAVFVIIGITKKNKKED